MNNKSQIFFLHFAGGSRYSYNFLSKFVNDLEVHQLELPGRGARTLEPLLNDIETAVEDYTNQIVKLVNNQPFVIFGHSMGATIGARVAKKLEQLNLFAKKVIVSGNAGPGVGKKKNRHLMEKKEFLVELKEIGGMSKDFFEHDGLVDFFLPTLKSDFKIIEQEPAKPLDPIQTPILAMMGDGEEEVAKIENWGKFTQAEFQYKIFKGDHFFIHQHSSEIGRLIKEAYQ